MLAALALQIPILSFGFASAWIGIFTLTSQFFVTGRKIRYFWCETIPKDFKKSYILAPCDDVLVTLKVEVEHHQMALTEDSIYTKEITSSDEYR